MVENVFDETACRFIADAMAITVLPVVLDVLMILDHLQHGWRQNGAPGRVPVQSMLQATVLEDEVDLSCTSIDTTLLMVT